MTSVPLMDLIRLDQFTQLNDDDDDDTRIHLWKFN